MGLIQVHFVGSDRDFFGFGFTGLSFSFGSVLGALGHFKGSFEINIAAFDAVEVASKFPGTQFQPTSAGALHILEFLFFMVLTGRYALVVLAGCLFLTERASLNLALSVHFWDAHEGFI